MAASAPDAGSGPEPDSAGEAKEAEELQEGEIKFDPPLGKVPPFTFTHPVLQGASARWNNGGGVQGLLKIFRDDEANTKALRTLVYYTILMAAVPAMVMACSYWLVLDFFFTFATAGDRMLYAGIGGIISVQCVIVAFLITAFTEPVDDPKAKKRE